MDTSGSCPTAMKGGNCAVRASSIRLRHIALFGRQTSMKASSLPIATAKSCRPSSGSRAVRKGEPMPVYERMVFDKFEFRGFHCCRCICSLEILLLGDLRCAVIATEREDNPGTLITN